MSLNLTYNNVNKYFNKGTASEVHALKEVSFTIKPGELFCLLGPSGCGKTTLLRSTAGLESISDGHILYGETDMTTIPPYRRNIGMVFQSFALYPHMNIFENVAYGLRVRKISDDIVKKKVTEVMELVGLTEELKRNPSPMGLSGGQQQRVAIARALVYDPDILLLDEPLANLDAKLRRYMRAEIRRIQKATNITTIFVTHDQEEAMAIGDRLAVLRLGEVKQIGSADELYSHPESAFVSNFIGKMNFFKVERKDKDTVKLNKTNIEFSINPEKDHSEGSKILLLGARPEQISISTKKTEKSIPGKVGIIQHLGQFVRYEVKVDKSFSENNLEIDMPFMVKDALEGDSVFINLKEDLVSLYADGEISNE